jgi:hypothetical protein
MASSIVDGATSSVLHLRLLVEALFLVDSHSGQNPKRYVLLRQRGKRVKKKKYIKQAKG